MRLTIPDFASSDVYGRGYSEAPRVSIDANLCILQLALLLQYIHWDRTDVVGFSMVSRNAQVILKVLTRDLQGGAIAASFASMFPHLVAQNVVFVASAGLIEVGLAYTLTSVILTCPSSPRRSRPSRYVSSIVHRGLLLMVLYS